MLKSLGVHHRLPGTSIMAFRIRTEEPHLGAIAPQARRAIRRATQGNQPITTIRRGIRISAVWEVGG